MAPDAQRRLRGVEARLQSLEDDVAKARSGTRLAPLRPVSPTTSERLRQIAAWQVCLGLGSALVLAAVLVALL
ncbi:MAG: hypothetical protein M3063_03430 [Actinomycetota bacterium]|nr:hypothetical protein [Actinomycetota bacterium]